jgi:uncharacterized membrane protein
MDDARISVQQAGAGSVFSVTVKRNCSMSPWALVWLLGVTACLSFAIGIAFAVLGGAWPILPFVGLEIAALAVAFYVNGRHATDYERITLAAGSLAIEIRDGDRIEEHRFAACWARLVWRDAKRDARLLLRVQGKELEIGRHLDAPGRALLAKELRGQLAGAPIAG